MNALAKLCSDVYNDFDFSDNVITGTQAMFRDGVIVFRGTEEWRDIMMNLHVRRVCVASTTEGLDIAPDHDWRCTFRVCNHPKVHGGFWMQFCSARAWLRGAGVCDGSSFTGHSLGGAVATLAAVDYACRASAGSPPSRLTTFGAPRVGNARFATMCDRLVLTTRVVGRWDIVPRLLPPPLWCGFKHPEVSKFISVDTGYPIIEAHHIRNYLRANS